MINLRLATISDVPAIATLIEESVMGLQASDYTLEQRQAALGTVFGVDRLLIADGTYFAVVDSGAADHLVACGGWSKRRTLFGSDNAPDKHDDWLDPAIDAARIRAFFVHPGWARKGLATRLLEASANAARNAGFTRLELGATLTGIPFYERHGFRSVERIEVALANGTSITIERMTKPLLTS